MSAGQRHPWEHRSRVPAVADTMLDFRGASRNYQEGIVKRLMLAAAMIAGLTVVACTGSQDRGPQAVPQGDDNDAYETGVYAEARNAWEEEAEQGDATSQKNLGVMYYLGQGVDPDYAMAFDWFSKAAAQGEDIAQLSLGVMYTEGQGVPQDDVRAHMWFSLSASQGNSSAEQRLEALVAKMSPEQITEAQALADAWNPGG